MDASTFYASNPSASKTPDAEGLAYWNSRIAAVGPEAARKEFDTSVAMVRAQETPVPSGALPVSTPAPTAYSQADAWKTFESPNTGQTLQIRTGSGETQTLQSGIPTSMNPEYGRAAATGQSVAGIPEYIQTLPPAPASSGALPATTPAPAPSGALSTQWSAPTASPITSAYQDLFGRAPEKEGFDYWTNELKTKDLPTVMRDMAIAGKGIMDDPVKKAAYETTYATTPALKATTQAAATPSQLQNLLFRILGARWQQPTPQQPPPQQPTPQQPATPWNIPTQSQIRQPRQNLPQSPMGALSRGMSLDPLWFNRQRLAALQGQASGMPGGVARPVIQQQAPMQRNLGALGGWGQPAEMYKPPMQAGGGGGFAPRPGALGQVGVESGAKQYGQRPEMPTSRNAFITDDFGRQIDTGRVFKGYEPHTGLTMDMPREIWEDAPRYQYDDRLLNKDGSGGYATLPGSGKTYSSPIGGGFNFNQLASLLTRGSASPDSVDAERIAAGLPVY